MSQKKSTAWFSYCNAVKQVKSYREEYKLFCKLTKEAAEKAQNAWWTVRAVEAERHAWGAEQLGHGGSLHKGAQTAQESFHQTLFIYPHCLGWLPPHN